MDDDFTKLHSSVELSSVWQPDNPTQIDLWTLLLFINVCKRCWGHIIEFERLSTRLLLLSVVVIRWEVMKWSAGSDERGSLISKCDE